MWRCLVPLHDTFLDFSFSMRQVSGLLNNDPTESSCCVLFWLLCWQKKKSVNTVQIQIDNINLWVVDVLRWTVMRGECSRIRGREREWRYHNVLHELPTHIITAVCVLQQIIVFVLSHESFFICSICHESIIWQNWYIACFFIFIFIISLTPRLGEMKCDVPL